MADGRRELIWRKSRSCASQACVEVARDESDFLVRDSTDIEGPVLQFDAPAWALFVAAIRRDDEEFIGAER